MIIPIDAEKAFDKTQQSVPQEQLQSISTDRATGLKAAGAQRHTAGKHKNLGPRLDRISSESCMWAPGVLEDKPRWDRTGRSWPPLISCLCAHRATASVKPT